MEAASPKRSYTEEQKAEALRLYREVGAAEASRQCGVNSATLRVWAHRAGLAGHVPPSEQTKAATDAARRSWAQRRLELAEETGAAAADLLARIRKAKRATDVRALADAYKNLVVQGQLLDGAVTERVEVSENERIDRVRAMRDEVAARRAARTG